MKVTPQLKHIYNLWAVILIIWALYRVYVHVPEWVDELIAKPLVFVAPVLWYVLRVEHRPLVSLGLTRGHLGRDLKIGLGFGMVFALEGMVANSIKHGSFSFAPVIPVAGFSIIMAIILSIATAVSEEILSRGFVFGRLLEYYQNTVKAVSVSSILFLLLHVPIIFTTLKLTGATLAIFILTDIIIAVTTSILYSETKTLTVPILVHAFWNMTVALYL